MRKISLQRPWAQWLVVIGWSVLVIFFASRNIVTFVSRGQPVQWTRGVLTEIIYWYVWLMMIPVILWFARRFLLGQKYRRPGRFALALLFGVFIVAVQSTIEIAVNLTIARYLLRIPETEMTEWVSSLPRVIQISSFTGFLTYAVIVGGFYAYDYYRKYQERDRKATQLEGMLAQAELQNLKMQMHPHFLFNTLQSISILMNKDTEAANQMLIRLSDLLRMTLENVGAKEVLLKEELEFLTLYLEIEQIRFQDRLTVRMEIAPEILDARVPSFILQPLVENAIRHGIAPLLDSGVIGISGSRENGMVQLKITDNGPGIGNFKDSLIREGIGLSTTRARLAQIYGEKHNFEIRGGAAAGNDGDNGNSSGGNSGGRSGTIVTIMLPFRNAEEQDVKDEK